MIENAARFGPRNWAAHLRRHRTELWVQQLIRRIRNGAVRPPDGSAAAVVAGHQDRQGHLLPEKSVAELILYGTNHDPPLWNNPESFQPGRFKTWSGDPNTLIPQCGGDPNGSHRCPGDKILVELAKKAILLLIKGASIVPAQDLTFSLSKIPALPRSGVILRPAPGQQAH